jgi:Rieske 2Fe-2S family protein
MRSFVRAAALPSSRALDAERYVSEEVFARERERIFSRSWICIGRCGQLPHAGSFVTVRIAGESLIVARERAGALHAFYNVCRHRGTRMCEEAAGTFKGAIQCPYHAWTYGLDGTLLSARNMEETPDFDRARYPLLEAQIAQFEDFIFVALDPADSFEEAFPGLHARFAPWHIGELQSGGRIEYDLACNWKLVFQNYSECYHCPVIHPQLEKLSPSESGRNDCTEGAVLGGYSTLRVQHASLTTSGVTARPPLPGVTRENLSRVYYYTIFPSLLLSLHPDYVMAHYVHPVAPGRTRVICEWLFHPDAMRDPQFDAGDAIAFWDETNRQDWHVNELTQLGVASRAYVPGPYSAQEGLLAAFDRHYLHIMDGTLK